ncbi:MAG: hypothetical protein KatS3mg068_2596 [Candidatus Sericytochromatia bacterium]|nr:MAG: hypothetical protein KatS3mg068_2596 [Candidatus Sericytochromatia bacterium]
MEYFCFIEWDEIENNELEIPYLPKIPDNIPFMLIAGNPDISKWGLFECDLPEDYDFVNPNLELVSEELDILLYSAKSFPPAIAIARNEFEITCNNLKNITKQEFTDLFSKILKNQLQLQKYRPFFMAEALVDEEDFLVKGAFYWITGFDPENNEVDWVSDDYFIYQSPIEDFGLNPHDLKRIFLEDIN